MWFGACSCLSVGMRKRGLVCPLFVAKTTWFGILNFRKAEEEWVGHDVNEHEVRNSYNVQVGFRLVEEPVQGIKSPFSKGVCRLGGVGWVGQGRAIIIKVPVVIIDGDRWEQNGGMLVWLGRNVLGCLFSDSVLW